MGFISDVFDKSEPSYCYRHLSCWHEALCAVPNEKRTGLHPMGAAIPNDIQKNIKPVVLPWWFDSAPWLLLTAFCGLVFLILNKQRWILVLWKGSVYSTDWKHISHILRWQHFVRDEQVCDCLTSLLLTLLHPKHTWCRIPITILKYRLCLTSGLLGEVDSAGAVSIGLPELRSPHLSASSCQGVKSVPKLKSLSACALHTFQTNLHTSWSCHDDMNLISAASNRSLFSPRMF